MSHDTFPTVHVRLQGLEYHVSHAFSKWAELMGPLIEEAVQKAISEDSIRRKVYEEASQIVQRLVQNTIANAASRAIYDPKITEAINRATLKSLQEALGERL